MSRAAVEQGPCDLKGGAAPERLVLVSRGEILRRIRGEYMEMPGLRLTHAQAQRLWGLDAHTCARMLGALVEDQFLCLGNDGAYGRFSADTTAFRPRPLAAEFFADPAKNSHRATTRR